MYKKGQMKLSFGMIFSVLLIILFLVFGFFAIQKFLDLQDQVQIKKFYENLENDVERAWKSTKASNNVEYFVPSDVEGICISSNEITLMGESRSEGINQGCSYRLEIGSKKIEHMEPVSGEEYISSEDGKIEFLLTKDYGDAMVTIGEA